MLFGLASYNQWYGQFGRHILTVQWYPITTQRYRINFWWTNWFVYKCQSVPQSFCDLRSLKTKTPSVTERKNNTFQCNFSYYAVSWKSTKCSMKMIATKTIVQVNVAIGKRDPRKLDLLIKSHSNERKRPKTPSHGELNSFTMDFFVFNARDNESGSRRRWTIHYSFFFFWFSNLSIDDHSLSY